MEFLNKHRKKAVAVAVGIAAAVAYALGLDPHAVITHVTELFGSAGQ